MVDREALIGRLRMEAWHLYTQRVYDYGRQLRAMGLDPDVYPDGTLTTIGEHKRAMGQPYSGSTRKAVEIGSVLRRSESISAQTYNATANTIDATWTTGASVFRSNGFGETFSEELVVTPTAIRMGRLNSGAPFLNSHQSGDVSMILGSIVPGSARIAYGKGTCTIALSTDPAKAGIVGDIKAARIRNVSVGYRIYNFEIIESKRGEPWTMRVTDWEPFEISAVAAPADPYAQMH